MINSLDKLRDHVAATIRQHDRGPQEARHGNWRVEGTTKLIMQDIQEVMAYAVRGALEVAARAVDEAWRDNRGMNCTEVCATIRAFKPKPGALSQGEQIVVGDVTMNRVFTPAGLTNISDLQAVFDAVEAALLKPALPSVDDLAQCIDPVNFHLTPQTYGVDDEGFKKTFAYGAQLVAKEKAGMILAAIKAAVKAPGGDQPPSPVENVVGEDALYSLRQEVAKLCIRGSDGGVALVSLNTVLSIIDGVIAETPEQYPEAKKLDWKDIDWGVSNIPCAWDAVAVDIHRRYRVRWTSGDYTLFINGESKARYPTTAEAKAAAQSDYEKRQTPPPSKRESCQ